MRMDIMLSLGGLCYLAGCGGYAAYLFKQKSALNRAGLFCMWAGFIVHTLAVGRETIVAGYLPVDTLRQTLIIASWCMAGAFLGVQVKYRLKILGVLAAPLVAVVMAIAVLLPSTPFVPNTLLNNAWLIFHIMAIFSGEASLAMACAVGCLYLLQEHAIKAKKRGFFFRRLPSLELLDTVGYGCIVVGFTLLSVGLITGFVYAKMVWGRFLSWDPKEVWSGVTWLIYAALLHQRLTVGWRGKKAAIMAIVGFAFVLFTFLGVNFLLTGHHGAFTRF